GNNGAITLPRVLVVIKRSLHGSYATSALRYWYSYSLIFGSLLKLSRICPDCRPSSNFKPSTTLGDCGGASGLFVGKPELKTLERCPLSTEYTLWPSWCKVSALSGLLSYFSALSSGDPRLLSIASLLAHTS